jgi:5-methylcytosine-specific restriction enzyme subunit McrC
MSSNFVTTGRMDSAVVLTEGVRQPLALTPDQLSTLTRLGFTLAGSSSWWGNPESDDVQRTVLKIEPFYGDQYSVTVSNAVGLIGLPDLSVVVKPKIPLPHFTHVVSRGMSAGPRLDNNQTQSAQSETFFDVVAYWFVAAAEALVRYGLARDYREERFTGPILRGRVDVVATMKLWATGTPSVASEVDEFDFNSPLNRVVRAAARSLRRSRRTPSPLLPRLGRLVRSFDGIGELEEGDVLARPRRGQTRYELPLRLARQVLAAMGPDLQAGVEFGETFLFPSPYLIEEGIRTVLSERLSPLLVRKGGKQLQPSTVRVNPDLVIGDHPYTGDVKYKNLHRGWDRPDLAQAVLFATAYRSPIAVIVGFGEAPATLPTLRVGDISVAQAIWDTSPGVAPVDAEERMVLAVQEALALAA